MEASAGLSVFHLKMGRDGFYGLHALNTMDLASEAATLQYIKASSDIPIPDVYDYR